MKDEILQKVNSIDAQLTLVEKNTLWDLAEKYIPQNGLAIEVGTWKGGGSYIIAEVCNQKNARLITIDIYDAIPISIPIENLKGMPVDFIKGNSNTVIDYLKDQIADFIFIDGGHYKPVVENDIVGYLKKVKSTGFFGGHDYGRTADGDVKEVVDRIFGTKIELFNNEVPCNAKWGITNDNGIWRVIL